VRKTSGKSKGQGPVALPCPYVRPAYGRIYLLGENRFDSLTAATRSVETPR